MSRQSQAQSARRPFWLYVDEFHHFITPSVVEILTGARKYNLDDSRASGASPAAAGFGRGWISPFQCGTRIVFRVGDADAKALAEGFADFEADSLRKLGAGEAICRVERSDFISILRCLYPKTNRALIGLKLYANRSSPLPEQNMPRREQRFRRR